MTAKTLMVQGTMSSAGKSLLVTALCRIFVRRGAHVVPFKAQNMSNNAAVCADGGEIGRAQYTQALACDIEPTTDMNPVLLKPEADARSQVIVNGRAWETLPARDYYERKQMLWANVTAALDRLRSEYELIIMEGAGSPAELNLKRGDIVNMAVAKYTQSPVLLAGDIDRGGIFAQLLGTLDLLEPDERSLVKGLIVNKFRGDSTLFYDGVEILEQRGGVPVLGVVPYMKDHGIPEEDAVAIEGPEGKTVQDTVDIAIIRLPRISNFDDFDALASEPGVTLRYVASVESFGTPDAVILPGTKSTIADIQWMQSRGLQHAVVSAAERGAAVVGICGGYQMLGNTITDSHNVESDVSSISGLKLINSETEFRTEKSTRRTKATIRSKIAWLAPLNGEAVTGYEIHMGQTTPHSLQEYPRWLHTASRGDGAMSADGRIWGCYLHGLFENDNFRRAWLQSLGWIGSNTPLPVFSRRVDRLATHVENALDMQRLLQIVNL